MGRWRVGSSSLSSCRLRAVVAVMGALSLLTTISVTPRLLGRASEEREDSSLNVEWLDVRERHTQVPLDHYPGALQSLGRRNDTKNSKIVANPTPDTRGFDTRGFDTRDFNPAIDAPDEDKSPVETLHMDWSEKPLQRTRGTKSRRLLERQPLNRDTDREGVTRDGPQGFVMAIDFVEQQTAAVRSLLSLQCLVGPYGLGVVEPAISKSFLGAPLSNKTVEFWFHNFYDIREWNEFSSSHGYSPLVKWSHFLSHAPHETVLVSFKHVWPKYLAREAKLEGNNYGLLGGCSSDGYTEEKLKRFNFTVVRRVCFNFASGEHLRDNERFISYLYGDRSPSSTTVVFTQWRGIVRKSSRVFIAGSKCDINSLPQCAVGPSTQLRKHIELYQQLYLGGAPYIAVVARMEKLMRLRRKNDGLVGRCFRKLLLNLNRTRTELGVSGSFLSIDVGQFGSSTFKNVSNTPFVQRYFHVCFKSVYGDSTTVGMWEESFRSVAMTTDSGYIAALQKGLAVRAECILFLGGGSFQSHIQLLYTNRYGGKCVMYDPECVELPRLLGFQTYNASPFVNPFATMQRTHIRPRCKSCVSDRQHQYQDGI